MVILLNTGVQMNLIFNKTVYLTSIFVGFILNSATIYAQSTPFNCPVLTPKIIVNVIDNGMMGTEQGYTLATESAKTGAQVLIDEPTANPFDTYYSFYGQTEIESQKYSIYIGNVLGKDFHEAKDRLKKIILDGQTNFQGTFNLNTCIYKSIDASPTIANYPFKSKYESIALVLAQNNQNDLVKKFMQSNLQKNN